MTKRERLLRRLQSGWNEILVRDAVLETDLSKDEKLVLLALVSHANEKRVAGAERGLSVRRVALLASINKDTPAKMFAKLETAGFVRVLRHPRARHADRFDLSDLPPALVRALSGPEGQALSDGKGQTEPTDTSTDCPSAAVSAVPPQQSPLSDGKGAKGSQKGSEKEPITPRRRAAESEAGFALEAPEPPRRKGRATPKARERKRTDAEVASHREILDAYSAAAQTKTSVAPTIGSREAGAAWRLLDWTRGDGARAVAIVRGAVARDFGGTTSLVVISADPNKYLGNAKSLTRTTGPKQPNAGLWKPPVENL